MPTIRNLPNRFKKGGDKSIEAEFQDHMASFLKRGGKSFEKLQKGEDKEKEKKRVQIEGEDRGKV